MCVWGVGGGSVGGTGLGGTLNFVCYIGWDSGGLEFEFYYFYGVGKKSCYFVGYWSFAGIFWGHFQN